MPKGGANKLGRAGNADRRPERYPARGIKGTANTQCDLRDDTRQKANIVWPSRRQVRVKPRGASRKGPNRLLATHYAERLAFHTQLNPPNRRMRTRMYGGVGGEDRRLFPLSRWVTTDVFRKAAESRLTTDLHKLLAVTQKRPASGTPDPECVNSLPKSGIFGSNILNPVMQK